MHQSSSQNRHRDLVRFFIHRDEGPDDMSAHLRTILTHSDLTIPVSNGVCALGTWHHSFGSGGAGPGWLDPVILTGQLEGVSLDFLWSFEAKA